ncbi:T9SS type A sorting domain-containing protein [Dyadobacter sandarakinus]|uniref:T9SS type A sorting domain-containing protein n=1 Tax=Dyadobacter sandarakinus TaxID=2747268 RepID=A0ABX7I8M1_9BACT|nr:T9SS type A sorting domain-containing protein [Dyadobacter sandarakinus]QRR02461.1 T9SS type A sorting domain-containing protein [Dyadobacter sandarakinus]
MKKTFIKKGVFACIAILSGVISSFAQTITTGAVTPDPVCVGSSISVAFTKTGTFPAGTKFTVQLSNILGGYIGSTDLGTGTTSPISLVIPANVVPGALYKVRVIAESPDVVGSDSETLTINATPAAPAASDVTYKQGDTAAPLNATGINKKWYTSATGGTGSATAPVPSTATAGTKSYFVTQTLGSCESERTEIKVTVTVCNTAKPVVKDISYCQKEDADALTATGTSLKWYTTATGGTASATAPTPSTTTTGTRSYYVTQTINGCESERAEIEVTVKAISAAPTLTAAESAVTLCQGSDAKALTASGTGLKWYTASAGGTALLSAPVPDTDDEGIATYYVSQTASNSCESSRVKVTVTVKESPKAPTVADTSYCVGEKAVALTVESGNPYKWYTTATGGTGSATAPTPATTAAASVSYYVTQANTYGSLVCESPRAKLDVVVNPTPATIPALIDSVCQDLSGKTYTFDAKAAQGNTLNWYTAATGGTGVKTTPAVNLKTAAQVIYYVTQESAKGCESVRSSQKVVVKTLPAAPVIDAPTVEYCQFTPAKALTATALSKATLYWYGSSATGGTGTTSAPVPSTLVGGTTSYYVGQTLAGCVSTRTKIDVKINTTPKPQTNTSLSYCQNAEAPILDATGTVLKWYREANSTDWQGFPFTPYTEKVEDYSFYVTQTGTNGCESPKEEIKIHIKARPSATISGNANIDLGGTATITLNFTGDGPWAYALSSGQSDTTNQATVQLPVKPTKTTTYSVAEVSNDCGKGTPIGSAVVSVRVPTISTGSPSASEACAGKSFNVPFQQSGEFPAGNQFRVQISRVNQDARFWTVPSVTAGGLITATFPDTTTGGSYFVRVVSIGANADFTVKGSVSPINITASPLPVATLSGNQTIIAGETANLKAEITGRSPWTFVLSDGVKDSTFTTSASSFNFKVAPRTTSFYTIKSVSNSCGVGKGAGSARIQVDPILGVEPPAAAAAWVKIYPTLVQGSCTVEITGTLSGRQAKAEILDLNGRQRSSSTLRSNITEVNFSNLPSGLYLLRVQNGDLSTVQRVLKP